MAKEKVTCKTFMEFITMVADSCINDMTAKDKKTLIHHPCVGSYHFSYGMYIRNRYIHNKDFSDVSFFVEPDHLSSEILNMILSKLIPEYEYGNPFVKWLYADEKFIELRKEYKIIYGEYPTELVEKYKGNLTLAPELSFAELLSYNLSKQEREKAIDSSHKNFEMCIQQNALLIRELSEKVWRTDNFRLTVENYGLDFNILLPEIERIKKLLFEERHLLPLEVCLLPYKKVIGTKQYNQYRKKLCSCLNQKPYLMHKFDPSFFNDRVLAKSVLKYGGPLKYLPQYQDDDIMIKYTLSHRGEAIEYASKRFQTNLEWVRFAIEHSQNSTIMNFNCMNPYRADRDLVYLACRINQSNFEYVSKPLRDDYDLAKLCLMQPARLDSIFKYMSKRLRDNKDLAMLDLNQSYPSVEYYSSRLRNDDEIAAELYRLHGPDSFAWKYMSKRIQKKYQNEIE